MLTTHSFYINNYFHLVHLLIKILSKILPLTYSVYPFRLSIKENYFQKVHITMCVSRPHMFVHLAWDMRGVTLFISSITIVYTNIPKYSITYTLYLNASFLIIIKLTDLQWNYPLIT